LKNGQRLKEKTNKAISNSKSSTAQNNDSTMIDEDIEYSSSSDDEIETLNSKMKKKNTKNKNSKPNNKKSNVVTASETQSGTAYVDQGYTRPRVLILCPFRSSAYAIVNEMIEVLGKERTKLINFDKFEQEYGVDSDDLNDESGKIARPEDWKSLFDESTNNCDDDFKCGIQVTPGMGEGQGALKGSLVRLYSDFFQSDIILASPLALRLSVEQHDNGTFDFLSSIEIVYLHQGDVLYMQNWDHVEYIMKNTNLIPTNNYDVDFSRIRPYFLEGYAKNHRQLVMSSAFNDPSLQSLWRQYACSISGNVRFKQNWNEGCLHHVTSQIQQIFHRVTCNDMFAHDDAKFNYFNDTVLTQLLRLQQSHTLIVTPSYLDYVRVRNKLIHAEVIRKIIL
jgi:U3 small nucleolar RNA-associated protein 25